MHFLIGFKRRPEFGTNKPIRRVWRDLTSNKIKDTTTGDTSRVGVNDVEWRTWCLWRRVVARRRGGNTDQFVTILWLARSPCIFILAACLPYLPKIYVDASLPPIYACWYVGRCGKYSRSSFLSLFLPTYLLPTYLIQCSLCISSWY